MIAIPYGKTTLHLNEEPEQVVASKIDAMTACADGARIVEAAMAHPIDSPALSELARGKNNCVVIISDHTRPVPSRDILPPMLRELRRDNPEIRITLLVATGCHRETSKSELVEKLGSDIVSAEHIVIHDCMDAAQNVRIGTLPSGAPLVINKTAVETELLVAEGFIEPHFFAGFSGGRKSVLPGICDTATVFGNHCSRFIDSPYARTGILAHNPIHADMIAAARLAKLRYIVNVIINEDKKTVAAFAGHPEAAHEAGCACLREYCLATARRADIIITSNGGAPLDQNLYQCVKCMTAAEACANPGAVVIVCAECADGIGGDGFYRSLSGCDSPDALYEAFMATPQDKTIRDQWQSQVLARILRNHTVIFVTRPELQTAVMDMKMLYCASLNEAIETARRMRPNAGLTVIPNGISLIVEPEQG